jgi:hypothetical protein
VPAAAGLAEQQQQQQQQQPGHKQPHAVRSASLNISRAAAAEAAQREAVLAELAQQFAAQLPAEGGVSMAQLQGFLMTHRWAACWLQWWALESVHGSYQDLVAVACALPSSFGGRLQCRYTSALSSLKAACLLARFAHTKLLHMDGFGVLLQALVADHGPLCYVLVCTCCPEFHGPWPSMALGLLRCTHRWESWLKAAYLLLLYMLLQEGSLGSRSQCGEAAAACSAATAAARAVVGTDRAHLCEMCSNFVQKDCTVHVTWCIITGTPLLFASGHHRSHFTNVVMAYSSMRQSKLTSPPTAANRCRCDVGTCLCRAYVAGCEQHQQRVSLLPLHHLIRRSVTHQNI